MALNKETILVLKGAYKTLVLALTGVLISNIADPVIPLYTHQWFKHVGIVTVTTVLLLEARYWNKWARNGKDTHAAFDNSQDNDKPSASG